MSNKKFRVLIKPCTDGNLDNRLFDDSKIRELSVFAIIKKMCNAENIDIQTIDKYEQNNKSDLIIFFDIPFFWKFHYWKIIFQNRNRCLLFCFEPPVVNPFNYYKILHLFFKKVYTWNDDLVDNKKYFKFCWHQSKLGVDVDTVPFNNKKFISLINGNKLPFSVFNWMSLFGKELYSKRIEIIEYFEKYIPQKFDLYGRGWNRPKKFNLKEKIFGFKKYKVYRGEIDNKIKLLSGYKYNICFENLENTPGYFTEKIFDCLKAKCVPVYLGASNVEKYIPKNCFIDFRDFKNYNDLLDYLKSIDEESYNNYVKNINNLLSNKAFMNRWFDDGWAEFFLKVIKDEKNKFF